MIFIFNCYTSEVDPCMSSQQDRYHPPLLYRNVIILSLTLLQKFHYFPQLLLTPKCQTSQTTSNQGVHNCLQIHTKKNKIKKQQTNNILFPREQMNPVCVTSCSDQVWSWSLLPSDWINIYLFFVGTDNRVKC